MEHPLALTGELEELIIRSAKMNDRTVEEEVLTSARAFVSADFLRRSLHKHQPLSDEMRRFLETLSESDAYLDRPTHAEMNGLTQPQITSLFSWLTRFLNQTSEHNNSYSWEDYLEAGPNGYRMPDYLRQIVRTFLTQ